MKTFGSPFLVASLLSVLLAFINERAVCARSMSASAYGKSDAVSANLPILDDPHQWLEDIEGAKSLEWVKSHNQASLATLERSPQYKSIEGEVRKILLAKDRIPMPTYRNGFVYNFWQDASHVRGLYRRTTLTDYARAQPNWETVLDFDRLAADEKENWVRKGGECLAPQYERCLLKLSRGGKDAVVVREYDFSQKKFISPKDGGFEVSEAKTNIEWIDRDHVLVATYFGPDSLTLAGYPRQVKLWTRGQDLAKAELLMEVPREFDEISAESMFRVDGNLTLIVQRKTFFEQTYWTYDLKSRKTQPVNIPSDATVEEFFGGKLLVKLRTDWSVGAQRLPGGALVALSLGRDGFWASPELVFAPDSRSAITSVTVTRDALLVNTLTNVKSKILKFVLVRGSHGQRWHEEVFKLPENGTAEIVSSDPFSDVVFTAFESFLLPTSLLYRGEVLKSVPARFNARGLQVEQLEAPSEDGTLIPYYVVHKRSIRLDGHNPTLIYGYGGFEIPELPHYNGVQGKVWLERGGVYVVANIRGGGEFGPKWHQAALKENRQKAFDDFRAVAEDLIRRKITSPAKLGIMGGSNGGLLMGATFTQHPELFGAVVCAVPLLDMLRYNVLLAGASWEAEYGNPNDPEMRKYILKYSPYQNVSRRANYPKVLFVTSTKDDRVHPGHARKMVARMEEFGHPVFYFENTEGGHGAAANIEQRVKMLSLEYSYLSMQLGVQ